MEAVAAGGAARRLGASGAAGASGGGGSSPAPRTRARYSLTARSRAPAAVSRNPGYLSAGRARSGAGDLRSRRGWGSKRVPRTSVQPRAARDLEQDEAVGLDLGS